MYLFSLLLFLTLGCDKDDQTPVVPLDGCGLPTDVGFIEKYPTTTNLIFNPNNSDEFAFLKDRYFSVCCQQELVIYNMATKEVKTIYNGSISSFEWSKQGKIIWQDPFTRFLYSMDTVGGNIFQLPLDTITSGAIVSDSLSLERQPYIYTLSPDGRRIFYDYSGIAGGRYVAIADLNGRRLEQQQTLAFYYVSRWQQDDLLTSLVYYDNYINFEFFDLEEVFAVPNQSAASAVSTANLGYITSMDWVDDRTLILSAEKGIYTVHLPNNLFGNATVNLIEEAMCPAEGYIRFAIDRQRKKLLVQRFEPEYKGGNFGVKNPHYYLMNFDGTDKQTIEIPGL